MLSVLLAAAAVMMVCSLCAAQTTQNGDKAGTTSDDSSRSRMSAQRDNTQVASADTINDVLQSDPALMDEVRLSVADQLRSRGMEIDSSDITDDAIFDRVKQDPALRARLTPVLLQRGAITREQLSPNTGSSEMEREGMISDRPSDEPPADVNPTLRRRSRSGETRTNVRPAPRRLSEEDDTKSQTSSVASPYQENPALQDLYKQFKKDDRKPERFGSDLFRNINRANEDESPMDLPAGPDYILGPGDSVTITLYGGVSQTLRRVVDREGRVMLPEVGAVMVAGKSLSDAETIVKKALATQFRSTKADLSLTRLRNVRVYVVGELAQPYGLNSHQGETEVPLAVIGVVPLKVTTANGVIVAGDLLVSSPIRGRAMKGTDRPRMLGAVVGKALEACQNGEKTILVLVTLQ